MVSGSALQPLTLSSLFSAGGSPALLSQSLSGSARIPDAPFYQTQREPRLPPAQQPHLPLSTTSTTSQPQPPHASQRTVPCVHQLQETSHHSSGGPKETPLLGPVFLNLDTGDIGSPGFGAPCGDGPMHSTFNNSSPTEPCSISPILTAPNGCRHCQRPLWGIPLPLRTTFSQRLKVREKHASL